MLRRLVLALSITALVISLVVGAGMGHANAAEADDTAGLDVSSASVFEVETASSVVRARVTLTFANSTIDQMVGTSIRRQYFTGYRFPVPVGSISQRGVDSNGNDVAITPEPLPGNDSFQLFALTFPEPLFSGDRTTVDITYDITGMPPRSGDPSRVNPAYVAFTAYGVGDAGKASVEVRIPSAFAIDTFGDDDTVAISFADGVTRYTVDSIADPGDFAFFVSARNDAALARSEFTSSGAASARFVVRSWPDDLVWQQFVTDQIDEGIPLLAQLIERPWPIERPVEIRQAVTPYLYGYAGWFSATNAELEMGEDLDPDTVLHELSHAWFNSTWFAERWASEGLAQVYTASALALLGETPRPAEQPEAGDPAAIALVDWGAPLLEQGADDVEAYGYSTSHWVMQGIVEEVGFAAIADVVDAIDADILAYSGDDTTPSTAGLASGAADWRRLLDLFEQVARSSRAADLIGRHVARPDDADDLAERTDARAAYSALVDSSRTWAPPLAVRQPMADWEFATALDEIDIATAVIAQRDQLQAVSDPLGIDVTGDLEDDYEAASNLNDVSATLDQRLAAATVVAEAVAAVDADPGLIEQIGLIGVNPDELAEQARSALAVGDTADAAVAAQRALDLIDDARGTGTQRAAIALAVALVIAVLAGVIARRPRRRSSPRSDQAADT